MTSHDPKELPPNETTNAVTLEEFRVGIVSDITEIHRMLPHDKLPIIDESVSQKDNVHAIPEDRGGYLDEEPIVYLKEAPIIKPDVEFNDAMYDVEPPDAVENYNYEVKDNPPDLFDNHNAKEDDDHVVTKTQSSE